MEPTRPPSTEWGYFIHYLRNTLGTLGSLADFYLSRPPDPEQLRKLLTQIKKVSDQSTGYINAFSELVRPVKSTFRPLLLANWLKTRIALHAAARTPNIKLEIETPDPQAQIEADPALLSFALGAFLDNALDAMPAGGVISVSSRLDDDWAYFIVRNSGDPVSQTVLADLGTPFLTLKPGRMGLGLGWAKRVAAAHGGEFSAENVPGGVQISMRIRRRNGGNT